MQMWCLRDSYFSSLEGEIRHMLREKEERYIELIKEMKNCHICQDIPVPAYCRDGEILLNDSHGIPAEGEIKLDNVYVNRWNMWQGSLDADIMVVGLDFGKIEIGDIGQPEEHRWWKEGQQPDAEILSKWKSPTDKKLYDIFQEVFGEGFLLTEKCDKLYFTNVACCYRQKKTSGEASPAWYAFCARRYLGRLIQIIGPKLIVPLGLQAFEALGYCEGGRLLCTDEEKPEGRKPLKELLDSRRPYHFGLEIGGKNIAVAPVFHPGANSKRNRTKEEEDMDWKRVHEIYGQVIACQKGLL